MKKYFKTRLYASLALILLLACFTLPSVVFKGVQIMAKKSETKMVPALAYPLYSVFTKGRYYSRNNEASMKGNLAKQLEASNELGVISLPIWAVSLAAPQYPKSLYPIGVPVFFHFDGYSGEVREMDTINHYVGMDPMEYGAPYVKALSPYALVVICLGMLLFVIYLKNSLKYFLLLASILPVVFLGIYAYWLYYYGHNMHDFGSFYIKPFMPTVFGDGKVAQFTTHSYPSIGFYVLLVISFLSLLSFASFNKARLS